VGINKKITPEKKGRIADRLSKQLAGERTHGRGAGGMAKLTANPGRDGCTNEEITVMWALGQ